MTDRAKPAGSPDAASVVSTVGPPDAGVDALVDSAVDDADSPVGSWCAINRPWSLLCDDFDLSMMPRSEWTPSGGGLGVVSTPFQSAPHALQAKDSSASYLEFDVASALGGKLELELQLMEDGTSTNGNNPILASLAGPGGKRVALQMLPGTGTGRCTFEGFTSSGPPFVDFTLSRGAIWHSVSLKISFNSNNNVTTVNLICIVDGTDHGLYDLTASSGSGNVTIDVGVRGTTTAPMEAYFDNVVIDVEK